MVRIKKLMDKYLLTMRIVLFALITFYLYPITVKSQRHYQLNDTLYVWSMQGAPIYEEADNPGSKIKTYYYGEAARVVDTKIGKHKDNRYIGKDFKFSGAMVKVIMQKDTGYVYDGYLSALRPLNPRSGNRGIQLLEASFGKEPVVTEKTRTSNGQQGEKSVSEYGKNIRYVKELKGNCTVETFTLNNVRLNGAYYFMMTVYSNYFLKDADSIEEPDFTQNARGKYHFTVKSGAERKRITIQKSGNTYEVSSFECELPE